MSPIAERVVFQRLPTFAGLELLQATYVTQTFARHTHNEFAIGVVEQGIHSSQWQGATWLSPAGSIIVNNPGDMHTGHAADEWGWSYRMLYPTPPLLQQLAEQQADRSVAMPRFPRPTISDPDLAGQLLQLHRALSMGVPLLEQESRLVWVLTQLVRRHASSNSEPHSLGREHRAVQLVCSYLQDHLAHQVSLDTLATLVGFSPFHLLRVFRTHTGIPPHQYHIGLRIAKAKALLASGGAPAEVALAVGFSDQSHLSRHFKRIVGVSPGHFAHPRNFLQDSFSPSH